MTAPGFLGLGALAGLLAGWALWGGARPPSVPAATQARIVALAADSARYATSQRAARDSLTAFQSQAAATTARMAALAASAARSGRRADSLAAVAARFPVPPDDSAAAYFREAYQDRTREADSLRTANGLAFQAMRGAIATANLCLKAQIDAEGRLNQTEQVNRELQEAIRKGRRPASLKPLLIGLALGAVAGHLLLK